MSQYSFTFQRGKAKVPALPPRLVILSGRSRAARRRKNPVPLPILLPGLPGYRTRPERSGLDYLASEWELAHMEGVFLRALFTFRLQTRDPFYLGLMVVFGLLPFLAGCVMTFQDLLRGWGHSQLLRSISWSWIGTFFLMLNLWIFLAVTGALTVNLILNLRNFSNIQPGLPQSPGKKHPKKKQPKQRKDFR
ncbi:MAG TPA: hypothetical protein VFF78_04615 [Anaerolineaceae bacterium]|nr:hypothetical protein [Anaerolineaceae bacterium]